MGFGVLLRLDGVIILIFLLFHPFNVQGREPYLCDFVKKINTDFYSDIYGPISFSLGIMAETTELFTFDIN